MIQQPTQARDSPAGERGQREADEDAREGQVVGDPGPPPIRDDRGDEKGGEKAVLREAKRVDQTSPFIREMCAELFRSLGVAVRPAR